MQTNNLLHIQLARIDVDIYNKNIFSLILNGLLKSWSIFKQIQKEKLTLPIFLKLKWLLL